MGENRNHFRVYMDVLRDVQEIIEKLDIEDKDNAVWDVIDMLSFGLHLDFVSFLLCNEPYLEDVAAYDSFEAMPEYLQQTVLRNIKSFGHRDFFRITENTKTKRLDYYWEEPSKSAWETIAVYKEKEPVDASYIQEAYERGVSIVLSKAGFTEGAKALARRLWVNLEMD